MNKPEQEKKILKVPPGLPKKTPLVINRLDNGSGVIPMPFACYLP